MAYHDIKPSFPVMIIGDPNQKRWFVHTIHVVENANEIAPPATPEREICYGVADSADSEDYDESFWICASKTRDLTP